MKVLKIIALSNSGFVFNPNTGDSFSVNPIGLKILRELQSGLSEDEIKKALLNHYQTDKETIEKDLYDFFKMIEQYNITELHEQA